MRGLYWKAMDTLGLMLLHRQKSIHSRFNADCGEWDGLQPIDFFSKPELPELRWKQVEETDHKLLHFAYPSFVNTGCPRNDLVSGLCYVPDKPSGKHAVVVHGWRMDSLDRVRGLLLEQLLELGYHVYFPYLPHHMDRMEQTELYSGEHMVSSDLPGTLRSVRQAVGDLRALLGWIRNSNPGSQITLIGISLGGCITNLTATVEQEIDNLVSVMYANSLSYSVWHTAAGRHIRKDLETNGMSYGKLCRCWSLLEPGARKPYVDKSRILLLSGRYDRYVLPADTDLLWEAWDRPLRKVLPFGHAGLAFRQKAIAEEITAFLESR